jgi:RHS repeat-associated protein
MGTDVTAAGSVISLPKGGGAVTGLGEKFAPDPFTGTGNLTVPIGVPAGRLTATPQLNLTYSTGNGNGPLGLGWRIDLPGVSRKTSHGVPRYNDADVFLLSGAEDLLPVAGSHPGRVRYRPRTEGLFARVEHVREGVQNYWEIRGKDGTVARHGTPRPAGAPTGWRDPATVADPAGTGRVFGWRITESRDSLGNLIRYEYRSDHGEQPGHQWDQPLIARISYADHGDRANPSFLVTVEFDYETRPDPFSEHRAGFEVRTSLRCCAVRIVTHAAGVDRVAREYRLQYQQAEFTGCSLLTKVDTVGVDDETPVSEPGQPPTELIPAEEHLPPLTFGYSQFDPAGRRFDPLTGPGLPTAPLSDPTLALVDLRGVGLPDVVELGAVKRYWSNAGNGRLELPRTLGDAPPFSLADAGVRLMDADGDGRPDLVVTGSGGPAGYFPMTFAAGWSRRSFQPYQQLPSVDLADPNVRLVDLDGDGLTDVLRSGTRLECWFNDPDPRRAWSRTAPATGPPQDVDLSDPRVRLADMTGDGLPDLVILRSGNVSYWPNRGHGQWGAMITMRRSPRFPDGHDPRRLLLGDVDGDGVADLVHVDNGRVLLWGNRSGNAWTETPIVVTGTPNLVDTDVVELVDLRGTGMDGLLLSRVSTGSGLPQLRFLDFTGDVKPHLLTEVDNHLGALTRVRYRPSTGEYLRDDAQHATRWRTPLPFPVQVVSQVEIVDAISGGRLTTEYRYHHGYWDGVEREFRGFAMVEQRDTETFTVGEAPVHYSPPTLTKSWFHPGPVAAAEAGDWTELDLRHEYWDGDAPMLTRPPEFTSFVAGLPRGVRRTALRALRGQLLRTELYALDGTERADRPFTVTESLSGIREESPPVQGEPDRQRVFFPFLLGERVTQWERDDEPMTQFTFPAGYDDYGQPTGQIAVAVPRGRDPRIADIGAGQPYLATFATTGYAGRDDPDRYLVDRVARQTSYEIVNDGRPSVAELVADVLAERVSLRIIGHSRTYYDGAAFVGLPLDAVGEHGLPVRTETLAFTEGFLDELGSTRPVYLEPAGAPAWTAEYPAEFRDLLPDLAGYRHYADTDVPGYYVITERRRYDVHEPGRMPRGLTMSTLDPLGAASRVEYDQYDLLPVRTIDAAGLTTEAELDYRVLAPRQVTDPNGNITSVTFSPAGLITAQFVRGKAGEGDQTVASLRKSYDLLAFAERGQPASVRSVQRAHHDADTDVPAGHRDDVIVRVEYSDGFGRRLQTRSQAEDILFGDPHFGGGLLSADQSEPVGDIVGRTRGQADPENVIVSGWQRYDNKGRVVQKYEPFYAVGFGYAQPVEAQLGQQTTMFYDPRGQAIRTVQPDGSEQRVVFGVPTDLADPDDYTPTPWTSYAYDANDNAGRTHAKQAATYKAHWNTPTSVEVDALGRTVSAVTRNGAATADWFTTKSTYDIQGNVVSITDALGREAFRYVYDLGHRSWRTDSIDAGRRDIVLDAIGAPIETRDGRGAMTLAASDILQRPIRLWARDTATGSVTLRQRIEYGDAGDPNQPTADRAAARAANLLGRPVRHHDEAGLAIVGAVDFKGNVLESTRQVIADAPLLAAYTAAATNGWKVVPFQVDWTVAPGQDPAEQDGQLLEPVMYTATTRYDALNRVTRHLFPLDVEQRRRELSLSYNRAGALDQVLIDDTVYVNRLACNAKGQRTLIAYGNGTMTRYAYDPHVFRLARMRTDPYTIVDGLTYRPTGTKLQDYGYAYDLAGNLLTVRDRTPGSGVRNNPAAFGAVDPLTRKLLGDGDALDRQFGYDPVYRLVTATGREAGAPPSGDPWHGLPRGTDVTLTQPYTEDYVYDAVSNLLTLDHRSNSGFTRTFKLETGSNRLQRMTVGKTPFDYAFDANGHLLGETATRHFAFSHNGQATTFATQTPGAEPSVHAQYLYDATGRRVKKLVRRQGGSVEVTHYLDESFEHHRWSGSSNGSNNHLHIPDDQQRIATVRVGPAHPEDLGPAVVFQLTDHLGSSSVVLDGTGALVNREEYTPYGESSFGSYARKRYRFTGKERDEESGLAHHGARSLLPWLARWSRPDPDTQHQDLSSYAYVAARPLTHVDPDGRNDVAVLSTRPVTGQESEAEVRAIARTDGGVEITGTITWLDVRWHATGVVPLREYEINRARETADFMAEKLAPLIAMLNDGTGTGSAGAGSDAGPADQDGSGTSGDSGTGKELDIATSIASLILDPSSLAKRPDAPKTGDGSPAGSSHGFITGPLAKILTVFAAAASIFGRIAELGKRLIGKVVDLGERAIGYFERKFFSKLQANSVPKGPKGGPPPGSGGSTPPGGDPPDGPGPSGPPPETGTPGTALSREVGPATLGRRVVQLVQDVPRYVGYHYQRLQRTAWDLLTRRRR